MKIWLPAVRTRSGTDVFTQRLASALDQAGHQVVVTWFPHFHEILPMLTLARPPLRTDVVHVNSWHAPFLRMDGVPLVATVHLCVHDLALRAYKTMGQRAYHATLVRFYESRTLAAAGAVTAVSQDTARRVEAAFPDLRKPVRVIHNWVDTDRFSPAAGRSSPVRRPFRLLFVGNWSPRKGVDLLGDVMRRLGPGFELHVVGLRGTARSQALANATILPRVEPARMVEIYRECDALLFPSRHEGLPYAPLEAQACGKPVIGFRTSSMPEVVVDGKTGLLARADDVAGLVASCEQLQGDRALYERLASSAREHVVRQFSEPVAIRAYEDAYQAVIDHR